MACTNIKLAALEKDCEFNKGGIKDIWIARYQDLCDSYCGSNASVKHGVELGKNANGHDYITNIFMKADPNTNLNYLFYHYYLTNDSAVLDTEYTIDQANGILFTTNTLTCTVPVQTIDKRHQLMDLLLSDVVVIAKDGNGRYYYMGYEEPVKVNTFTTTTGTASADSNNYNFTLVDTSKQTPYMIGEFDENGCSTGDPIVQKLTEGTGPGCDSAGCTVPVFINLEAFDPNYGLESDAWDGEDRFPVVYVDGERVELTWNDEEPRWYLFPASAGSSIHIDIWCLVVDGDNQEWFNKPNEFDPETPGTYGIVTSSELSVECQKTVTIEFNNRDIEPEVEEPVLDLLG